LILCGFHNGKRNSLIDRSLIGRRIGRNQNKF